MMVRRTVGGLMMLLGGCGEGLHSRQPQGSSPGPDAAADRRSVEDSPEAGADGPLNAVSVSFPAGNAGVVDMGDARLVLQSGTFDQDVTLTIESVPTPPRIGSITRVFRLRQQPLGVHARVAPSIEVMLSEAQAGQIDQLRLAVFKDQRSPGLWVSAADQVHDPASHALSSPVYNLDDSDVVVSILRACSGNPDCGGLLACSAGLCQ